MLDGLEQDRCQRARRRDAHVSYRAADARELWRGIDLGVSLGVYVLLFAAMFRVLPDVHIAWRDVWAGASITAVLFVLGKWLIGAYLARSDVGEAYGAAGSLVVLLVWVYYSSLIVLYGAELTRRIAVWRGYVAPPVDAVPTAPT
jgi:membrane protein